MRFLHIVILLDWSEQFPIKNGIPTCLIYDHAFLHYKWINGTVSLTAIHCYFTWSDRKKLINGWAHACIYIWTKWERNLLLNASLICPFSKLLNNPIVNDLSMTWQSHVLCTFSKLTIKERMLDSKVRINRALCWNYWCIYNCMCEFSHFICNS